MTKHVTLLPGAWLPSHLIGHHGMKRETERPHNFVPVPSTTSLSLLLSLLGLRFSLPPLV